MDMRPAFDRGDHRHADVGDVFQHLHTFVMHAAPPVVVANVAESRKVDAGNVVARASQDDHLVVAVPGDPVEGLCELGRSCAAKVIGPPVPS